MSISNLPYRVEYATDTFTMCNKCYKRISKDTVQFAIMQQSATDDSLEPIWFDKNCFFEVRRPVSVGTIDGLVHLRYAHQMEILKCLNDNQIDSVVETKIKQQNDVFFVIRDKLHTFNNTLHGGYEDHVSILEQNRQFIPNTQTEILNHLTDIICFGALPACSICKTGQLVLRNSTYYCTGYDSPWSKCVNTVKEPQRIATKLPAHYLELRGITSNVRTRILRNGIEISDEDFERHTKQPLFGMEFLVIGETKKWQNEIEDKVRIMGGKIATNIHESLAAVISTPKEVERNYDDDITAAMQQRIQIVGEHFLDSVMNSNDPIQLIVDEDITKRGRNPNDRIPKWEEAGGFQKWCMKDGPKVDGWKWQNDDDTSNVYLDGGLRYSVILIYVDIATNKNSYIKLHLIQSDDDMYTIFESKGRVGTSIGTKRQKKYSIPEDALREFNRIYQEKTGNKFGATKFVKQPGKYCLVKTNHDILSRPIQQHRIASKLPKPLYELMELLFDNENVIKSTLLAFCMDLDSMPLGKVDQQQTYDAMNVLLELSSALEGNRGPIRISAASNQFYSLYPHSFGLQRPPILNTVKTIQEKLKFLQHMLEKETTYDLLTSELNVERNLLDVCYEHIKDSAEISMLNKSAGMYGEICKYVRNTQIRASTTNIYYHDPGAFDVDEIYEVTRHEDEFRYLPYEENFNRQLLFHGSSINNFVNILTNGLKMSPPEAHFHGSMFGKGIYFSDSVSKAASYCYPNNGIGLVLLCEVAAGRSDIRYSHNNSKLISHCESVQAIGQYYPHPLHIRPDGLKVPNGTLIQRSETTDRNQLIIFNEFVVFDESRVKIRYIVKLKFNQKA